MARQTRAQRRARREARERSMAGRGGGGNGGDLVVAGAGGGGRSPEPSARPVSAPRRGGGGGVVQFIRESVGELRKVDWPGQKQVVQGTVVVIIACVIIGTYLYVADQVFNKFVSRVLLGQ